MADDEEMKQTLVKEFINVNRVDIFMMAEVNVNWKIVGKKHNLRAITRRWFRNSRTVAAHNVIGNSKKPYQPGRVAAIVSGDLASHVHNNTVDTRMIGRWCSQTLRGINGMITRIVTVYVPCNSKSHGCKTVFAQQQAALLKSKISKGVIKRFWLDFWAMVDNCIEKGENLIIGGDWNRNVTSKQIIAEFEERHMYPVITGTHGINGPATYNKGSYPIDEIFATPTLSIHACGYLEHGLNNSDHRPIWIELDKEEILGTIPPPLIKSQARRLQMRDP